MRSQDTRREWEQERALLVITIKRLSYHALYDCCNGLLAFLRWPRGIGAVLDVGYRRLDALLFVLQVLYIAWLACNYTLHLIAVESWALCVLYDGESATRVVFLRARLYGRRAQYNAIAMSVRLSVCACVTKSAGSAVGRRAFVNLGPSIP